MQVLIMKSLRFIASKQGLARGLLHLDPSLCQFLDTLLGRGFFNL